MQAAYLLADFLLYDEIRQGNSIIIKNFNSLPRKRKRKKLCGGVGFGVSKIKA
jgi:hypothetical protein